MITTEIKKSIVSEIKTQSINYSSAAKQAVGYGISSSQLSRIKKGDIDRVISDANWISIARKVGINLNGNINWKAARTETFDYIDGQLDMCRTKSISSILCDNAGIGKTFTAKHYVKRNPFSVYIDCSQVKTKQRLVRKIAQEFGVNHTGRYAEVYADLIYYIQAIKSPLIILDEAGDLAYSAFLELKALWNATERRCGWYMMGAEGLKQKIIRNKDRNKVGYAEIFDRYSAGINKVTPDGKEALEEFNKLQVALVTKANSPSANIQRVFAKTDGSLRRVFIELQKTA